MSTAAARRGRLVAAAWLITAAAAQPRSPAVRTSNGAVLIQGSDLLVQTSGDPVSIPDELAAISSYVDTTRSEILGQVSNATSAVSDSVGIALRQQEDMVNNVTSSLRSELSALRSETEEELTDRLEAMESTVEVAMSCEASGLSWNGSSCVTSNPILGSDLATCGQSNEGQLKYNPFAKNMEVCNGVEWVRAGKPAIGHSPSVPANSCEDIQALGEANGTGYYYVRSAGTVTPTLCMFDANEAQSVDFGTGVHGSITINRTVLIEALFPGYDPRNDRYPHWTNVAIVNGGKLTTAGYNADTGLGGIIAFKVNGTLSICQTCSIDVSALGHAGGLSPGRRAPRTTSERSPRGSGSGGGTGGCGGDCNGRSAHGAGGGGGSFRTQGTFGSPDRYRQDNYNEHSAIAGRTYSAGSAYWVSDPPMGSGGGAGGLGHRGSTPIGAPGSGGAGGGAIQIAAARVRNDGQLLARGEQGKRQWTGNPGNTGVANSNPQTGSGGSGSGGLIKIITGNGAIGRFNVSGGPVAMRQGWLTIPIQVVNNDRTWGQRVQHGQQGGEGGAGYAIMANVANITVGERCGSGPHCRLGTSRNPARSCQQLADAGVTADGTFYISTVPGRVAEWFCTFRNGAPSGYTWGDAGEGSLTITNTRYIEDIFPGYNPRLGQIPQFDVLTIRSGGTLKTRFYDGHEGGIVAFAARRLVISSGGQINADFAGYRGGKERYGRVYYNTHPQNRRAYSGEGPGKGRGGLGVKSCCHGSGGGGGSFGSRGSYGTPDWARSRGDQSATAGPSYNFRGRYFVLDEVMGSGGGAGGAGHPGSSYCAPFAGSPGGGTIMIMAQSYSNSGNIYARGKQGGPHVPYCRWPNSNPQVGSGGAGSGGGIKVMTSGNSAAGRTSVSGGARPIVQGWNAAGQRGGAGGNGRIQFSNNLRDV